MKGFKPMKNGRKSGFQFPHSFGFTGSTGKVTQVSGYSRSKFASGGAVKRVGRMTVTKMGDVGHATVQRSKPTTDLDQKTGGRTPLRRGFKNGGNVLKRSGALRAAGACKANGGAARKVPQPVSRARPGFGGAIKDFVEAVSGAVAPRSIKDRRARIDKAVDG